MYERLELYIETLTGTAFELRVSPYETIQDVKARIQKLEGIPISQQHLVWQSMELEDDYCLSDYSIHDGATLKLVLTMRGGPINTRRIPMDEPTLQEMAEFLSEANKEEIMEKVSNRPVTVIVYHHGDQLNFFRVVDRDSTSPLSESLSGASMYNLYDEEDDDEGTSEEKDDENDKTREKMKLLRTKMDSLTLNKKPKKKLVPRPPSSGRASNKVRFRRTPSASGSKKSSLNRMKCLPPVGQGREEHRAADTNHAAMLEAKELFHSATEAASAESTVAADSPALTAPLGIRRLESVDSSPTKQKMTLASVDKVIKSKNEGKEGETTSLFPATKESTPKTSNQTSPNQITEKELTSQQKVDQPLSPKGSTNLQQMKPCAPEDGVPTRVLSKETILRRAQSSLRASRHRANLDMSPDILKEGPKPPSYPRGKGLSSSDLRPSTSCTKGLERLLENAEAYESSSGPGRPPSQAVRGSASRQTREGIGRTSASRYGAEWRGQGTGGVVLESMDPSEVRAMSGMLSHLVRSTSRSRAGFPLGSSQYKDIGRMQSPDGRLLSGRIHLSASRDARVLSPRLPPVKQKKKSKRCFMCGKKTGLANSYMCRCSQNYCATHRYAEAHSCTFDYKTEGRRLLEQNNPVISAPKLPKI